MRDGGVLNRVLGSKGVQNNWTLQSCMSKITHSKFGIGWTYWGIDLLSFDGLFLDACYWMSLRVDSLWFF